MRRAIGPVPTKRIAQKTLTMDSAPKSRRADLILFSDPANAIKALQLVEDKALESCRCPDGQ